MWLTQSQAPGSTVNLYFFVLTPAPDDDDALKLLDPLVREWMCDPMEMEIEPWKLLQQ